MNNLNFHSNHYYISNDSIIEISIYNSLSKPFDENNPLYFCIEYDTGLNYKSINGLFNNLDDIYMIFPIVKDMGCFSNFLSFCNHYGLELSISDRLQIAAKIKRNMRSLIKEPPISFK